MRSSPFLVAALLAVVLLLGWRTTGTAQPLPPPRVIVPGSVEIVPGEQVFFESPTAYIGPSVIIINRSDQTATVTYDATPLVTVRVPVGFAVRLVMAGVPQPDCMPGRGQPHLIACSVEGNPSPVSISLFASPVPHLSSPVAVEPACISSLLRPRAPEPALGNLALAVSTDRPVYALGEAVTFTLAVTNVSDAPVTYYFAGPAADFIVRSVTSGVEVWRFTEARVWIPGPVWCTILPGETVLFAERWNQERPPNGPPPYPQVPPDDYTVTGALGFARMSRFISAPAHFTIEATHTAAPHPPFLTSPPIMQQAPLFAGCNNISLTWPTGTAAREVAAAITPASALLTIWRFDNATQTFQAYSPQFPEASNLTTVSRTDAVFICMREPGTLTRPAL